ncbi:MAG: hypothetical protein AAFR57_01815 [Pseudomonadota bacterium]
MRSDPEPLRDPAPCWRELIREAVDGYVPAAAFLSDTPLEALLDRIERRPEDAGDIGR